MNNKGKGADVSDPLLHVDPATLGFTAESSTATATTLLGGVDLGSSRVREILAGISDLTGTSTSSQLEGKDNSVVSVVMISVSVFVLFTKSYPSKILCDINPSLLSALNIDISDLDATVKSWG